MASEILNDEQIEWEAQRVAAAFAVKKFSRKSSDDAVFFCQGRVGRNTVRWTLSRAWGPVLAIQVGKGNTRCKAFCSISGYWRCSPHLAFNQQMAHGLYCLGVEETGVFVELGELSQHEKLELRLSLPREFWPPHWTAEVN